MTQEDKELLFKDLCARLPYHVRCKIWLKDGTTEEGPLDLEHNYGDVLQHAFYYNDIKDIKPYLRPMSNMTEEECDEIEKILGDKCLFDFMGNGDIILHKGDFTQKTLSNLYEFYNSHRFDYNGLIEKGLALEAPEGMYETEKQKD